MTYYPGPLATPPLPTHHPNLYTYHNTPSSSPPPLSQDYATEGAAVDVTMVKYHNSSTDCSAGTGLPCDFKFTLTFHGKTSGQ